MLKVEYNNGVMMIYKSLKRQAESWLTSYQQQNPAMYAAALQAVGGLLILDGFIGIDNPFGGKKRSGIIGSLVGVVMGLIMVFLTSSITNVTGLNKLTANTTAEVVSTASQTSNSSDGSTSTTCTPTATYTVNGQQYTQTASSGSSSACALTSGQTITIQYDPNNPGFWGYDTETAKQIIKIFPISGIIITIISLITFGIRLASIIFGWKLLKQGRKEATNLPPGTNIASVVDELRQSFSKTLFNSGSTIPQ